MAANNRRGTAPLDKKHLDAPAARTTSTRTVRLPLRYRTEEPANTEPAKTGQKQPRKAALPVREGSRPRPADSAVAAAAPSPAGGNKQKSKKKMPAATPKRVKNVRISRPFIIGNEAWELNESNRSADTPPDHTKGWRVYVKGTENGPNITAWLKKVQFKIYHTYQNPVRVVEEPPFQVEETGWGGFLVDVKLFFTAEAAAKPETRTHFLQLEPYGPEAERARQLAQKRVTSDYLEIIEFNEPPEALYHLLTGDEQWVRAPDRKKGGAAAAAAAKGKGKGKARALPAPDPEGTVELPESAPEGAARENPFTKEHERTYIAMLEGKVRELEAVKAREETAARAALERLEALQKKRAEQEKEQAAAAAASAT